MSSSGVNTDKSSGRDGGGPRAWSLGLAEGLAVKDAFEDLLILLEAETLIEPVEEGEAEADEDGYGEDEEEHEPDEEEEGVPLVLDELEPELLEELEEEEEGDGDVVPEAVAEDEKSAIYRVPIAHQ